jgi:pSer/pThr/pTyr-binding forkhead associated (FHA) protein
MITCPYCQHQLLEGTILCPECGASVIQPEEAGPPQQPLRPEPDSGSEQAPAASSGRTTATIAPTQLRFLVLNSGRMLFCPLSEIALIGRADPANGVFPELDLTQDNGYMAGVSRRHARIIRRGDTFYLEDLESANGTCLNRQKLSPHTPVPFDDGDEIRLGNLVLRVIMERNSL